MILKSKDTTVAYRCPYCGKCTTGIVGIFTLTGDMIKLKCACGHSELTVTYTSDGKIRLSVPCIFCPSPHNYVIGSGIFFDRGMISLDCTYSDIPICFIGTEEEVNQALEKSDRELAELLGNYGLDDYDKLHKLNRSDREPSDYDIITGDISVDDIVRFMLRELEDDKMIRCHCGEGQRPEYDFKIIGSTARVYCKTCNAHKDYPMGSSLCADHFLNIDEITLE
jgi:hypothetical protein